MKLARYITIIFALIICVNFASALSGSIGNARAIVRVDMETVPTVVERTILINNVNDIPIKVTVEPEDSFKSLAVVIDEEFILQPDESIDAQYFISLKNPGDYSGKIHITFTPVDDTYAGQPVGLSSNIIVKASAVEGVTYPNYEEETPEDDEEETETPVDDDEEEDEEEISTDDDVSTKTGPSPLVGIIIVAVIVILGGIVFYLLMRKGVL